jgi:hypothetical protein
MNMPPLLAVFLVIGLLLPAVAAAKPKHCLTVAELRAEQEVRHGIFLREASRDCEGEYVKGIRQKWQDFETKFGPKFRQQNDKRVRAFQREFPNDWRRLMTSADGRLVTYHRNTPLTRAYCDNVEELVQDITAGAYGVFADQAKTIQDEVIGEYKACR